MPAYPVRKRRLRRRVADPSLTADARSAGRDRRAGASPLGYAERDEAQLLLDRAHDLLLDLRAVDWRVEDLLRGRDHRVHDQASHHLEVLGAPRVEVWESCKVG